MRWRLISISRTRRDIEEAVTEIPGAISVRLLLIGGHAITKEVEAIGRALSVLVSEVLPARVLQDADGVEGRA